jgi:DNA-binding response OmpR family regulator
MRKVDAPVAVTAGGPASPARSEAGAILSGFPRLVALAGGLQARKTYVVHGEAGVGKTTFALQFLHQGLLAGEKVALVVPSAAAVYAHPRAAEFDLASFARRGALIVFEYLPQAAENAGRLIDDGQVFAELTRLLKGDVVQRVVLDPVTPLLTTASAQAVSVRAYSLVQTFAELGATGLFLFDTPGGAEYLPACKDAVDGVLRFETGASATSRSLVLERMPALPEPYLELKIVPGVGFVEVAMSAGPATPLAARRKVLVVEPDAEQRETLRGLLEKGYDVIEADSGAAGLARVDEDYPDLVVVANEIDEGTGVKFCQALRQDQLNLPIVVIANQIRRTHDRVEIMAAGVDECLERPFDGRILKLRIQRLLSRYNPATDRFVSNDRAAAVGQTPERSRVTATNDLATFYERVQAEATYASENAISFALLVLRQPDDVPDAGLTALAESLIREYDLVYRGQHFVAILLAETDEKGVNVFLRRFAERWTRTPSPTVQFRCYDRNADSYLAAKALIDAAASGSRAGEPRRAPASPEAG